MSDEAAFLRAIAESPDDDAPRLVFADWLDEHGEPARAEFIRLQCAAEAWPENHPESDRLNDRADELRAGHANHWEIGLPVGRHRYRRGFLDLVHVSNGEWVRRLPSLVAILPPACITVGQLTSETAAVVAGMSELAEVRRLRLIFSPDHGSDALLRLLRSPFLNRLTELNLWPVHASDASVGPALACWPGLSNVRRLGFSHGLTPAELVNVFESPHLAGVRSLELADSYSRTTHRIEALLRWPHLEQLEELELSNSSDEAFLLLIRSGRARRLQRLKLSDFTTLASVYEALAGLPALRDLEVTFRGHSPTLPVGEPPAEWVGPPLRSLSLEGLPIGDVGAAWLARLPRLAGASVLRLNGCAITAAGARALADSPHVSRLKALHLGANALRPTGVAALADSPHLSELQSIGLPGTEPGLQGMQALRRSAWARSLLSLDLSDNTFTTATTRCLAETPFAALRRLHLSDTALDWLALADADWLERLEVLDLGLVSDDSSVARLYIRLGPTLRKIVVRRWNCDVGDLRALLARPLSGLRTLDLCEARFCSAGIRELAQWPGLQHLATLSLAGCPLVTAGVQVLAASPYLHRSCTLIVDGYGVERSALDVLRERVGRLLLN